MIRQLRFTLWGWFGLAIERKSRRWARVVGIAVFVAGGLALVGCPGSDKIPQKIGVVGVAPYVAVPADGLAVRQADHRAMRLSRRLVQGVRYMRVGKNFLQAPSALPDVRPAELAISTRDVVAVDGQKFFVVTATCEPESTYSPDHLEAMRNGFRYDTTIRIGHEPGDPMRDLTDEQLFFACGAAIGDALALHYGPQLIDARGRAFVTHIAPRMTPARLNLPVDPGDHSLKALEYRYRFGIGFRSSAERGIIFDVQILIVPDIR